MRVLEVRNVTEAWLRLPEVLIDAEVQDSRNGPVLVCPEPVTTVYMRPTERVLLGARRDANPFFHLIEALWMLDGRDDATTLNYYIRDFGDRFAEDGLHVHGAYGHRWRHALGFDQLDAVVEKLRRDPRDRQAVIQMWDGAASRGPYTHAHVAYGCNDLLGDFKDRPCNTHVYLRVQDRPEVSYVSTGMSAYGSTYHNRRLDMTVCCRSNDMVFGGYGANAVHFSVLQEYLAARIGAAVGTLTQISNNFHVYRDVWERVRLTGLVTPAPDCMPMFAMPEKADADVRAFMLWHDAYWNSSTSNLQHYMYSNSWFGYVAMPMVMAYRAHRKDQSLIAREALNYIECPAWGQACSEWIARRSK